MSEAIEIYNGATFTVIKNGQNPSQGEIWATQKEMAKAFGVDVSVVTKHIRDILQSAELQEVETCANFAQVQIEGEKQVTRKVKRYNLDMLIAVGFRIQSEIGIRFRQWANQVLRKYSTQGCVMDIKAMANGYKKSELFAMLAEAYKSNEEQEQKLLAQAKTIDKQGQTITHLNKQVDQYATGFIYWAPLKEQPEGATKRRGSWVRPRKKKGTDNLLF